MFPQKNLKLISFILTRRGGSFGVHASSWWSHKSWNCWSSKLSRAYLFAIPTSAKKILKSQICNKNRQWHRNMICLDMVWYISTGITVTALIICWIILVCVFLPNGYCIDWIFRLCMYCMNVFSIVWCMFVYTWFIFVVCIRSTCIIIFLCLK